MILSNAFFWLSFSCFIHPSLFVVAYWSLNFIILCRPLESHYHRSWLCCWHLLILPFHRHHHCSRSHWTWCCSGIRQFGNLTGSHVLKELDCLHFLLSMIMKSGATSVLFTSCFVWINFEFDRWRRWSVRSHLSGMTNPFLLKIG